MSETGSTLIYPLFNVWASEYPKTHPDVTIKTAATGSGAGIDQAASGAVQIGASDSYMSDADAKRHPNILNIAMAISAQTVNYNLPGLNSTNLKLDGPTLAGIYTGKIRTWDDKAIAALNPGVNLPHNDIIPIRRAEGAGDTFIFTQYLTFSTESWENNFGFGRQGRLACSARRTGGRWQRGDGGEDKADALFHRLCRHQLLCRYRQSRDWHGGAEKLFGRIPVADAGNDRGGGSRRSARERRRMNASPWSTRRAQTAYPLINYEYAIVSTKQPNPAVAAAMRKFLLWAIAPDETNEKYLEDEHFIALPAHIWVLSHDQIMMIKSEGVVHRESRG